MTQLLSSLALAAALVLSTAACDVIEVAAQAQTGGFDRTLPVNGPVVLEVRTGSGDIQIKTGADDSVRVIGHIRAGGLSLGDSPADRVRAIEKAPPIEQTGTTVRIGQTGDNPLYRNVSISYEITVPANAQIQSRTGSGSQMIGSVRGSVNAQTGSGRIQIAETGGEVRAQTGSGDIDIDRAGGRLDAQAGSGHIHARAVAGAIRAQTGSGDVEMTQTAQGDADVQTGSGHVQLNLTENAAFELLARTGSGSIRVAQPMTTRVQSRHQLQGTVRGGGARVNVHTGSGSITIQ
jgi:hypothetical protein